MKKSWLGILVVVAVVTAFTLGVVADDVVKDISAELRPDFTIKVDGQEQVFKNAQGEVVYPVLYDGTTYLPVRAIGELMGKKVFWYEDDKRVELKDVTVTDADYIVYGEEKDKNKDSNKESFIGEEEAKRIALEKAGYSADEVRFERTELDEDDGFWHYEIEFITGGVEYDFDIGAVNGAILSYNIDHYDDDIDDRDDYAENILASDELISKDAAKEIALNKAGITADGTVFEDFELDVDDGISHYEMEFKKDGVEYEIDINAKTGDIIKFEKDLRD